MRIISGKARGTNLYTLEGFETRPTLDRVKESVFNIISQYIPDAVVLDLFGGSGAIGLEFASRGAKRVYITDVSKDAIKIIKKNIEKTHLEEKVELYNCDFKEMIAKIDEKMDFIYLDPPYKTDYIKKSLELLLGSNLIRNNTKIICETDEKERIIKEIEKMNLNVTDQRKYGRANILFLKKAIK